MDRGRRPQDRSLQGHVAVGVTFGIQVCANELALPLESRSEPSQGWLVPPKPSARARAGRHDVARSTGAPARRFRQPRAGEARNRAKVAGRLTAALPAAIAETIASGRQPRPAAASCAAVPRAQCPLQRLPAPKPVVRAAQAGAGRRYRTSQRGHGPHSEESPNLHRTEMKLETMSNERVISPDRANSGCTS